MDDWAVLGYAQRGHASPSVVFHVRAINGSQALAALRRENLTDGVADVRVYDAPVRRNMPNQPAIFGPRPWSASKQ